jgi:catechol 2,3-dioxygenase-like lactoylglutathione lyase family enzyme
MNDAFHDVAHLGHVELLTPEFEKSLWFFTDLLAMREVARDGDSVFLHAWDDYEHHTIKLTAAPTSGVGKVALAPPARPRCSAASQRSRRAGTASDGTTAGRALARHTRSLIRTGTRWTSTTKPSGMSPPRIPARH